MPISIHAMLLVLNPIADLPAAGVGRLSAMNIIMRRKAKIRAKLMLIDFAISSLWIICLYCYYMSCAFEHLGSIVYIGGSQYGNMPELILRRSRLWIYFGIGLLILIPMRFVVSRSHLMMPSPLVTLWQYVIQEVDYTSQTSILRVYFQVTTKQILLVMCWICFFGVGNCTWPNALYST